jgi:prolyl oligopeptidase
VLILTSCLIGLPVLAATKDTKLKYPETRRVDQVDEYFGVKVPDPYRWLEADVRESPEVADWAKKQNEIARKYLGGIPQRPAIEKRLTELWNFASYSMPYQLGGKYFFAKNNGLQNQFVLYVADSYKSEGRVLVDPNTWTKDGTIAMSNTSVSDDGRLLAYTRSESGSDWEQIYIVDVATGKAIDEPLKWARTSEIAWTTDGSGFYYDRYAEPPQGKSHQSLVLNQMVSFHKIGTKQADDKVVYRRPDHPDWDFEVIPTEDGKYLFLSMMSGNTQNQVLVRDASAPVDAPFKELIGDFKNQFRYIANEGTKVYYLTDLDAPTKRVVTMDIEHPGREHAAEVVPARKATLTGAGILSGHLICHYLVDVLTQIEVFDLTGKSVSKVELPGKGTAVGFGGRRSDKETFFLFTSYNLPWSIYRYDVLAGTYELVRQPSVKFDPAEFVVEQVFYESKDGTRVPMMLTYRKNMAKDRPHPTLLYGYGGYGISKLPAFDPENIAWMELGGVLAVANIRGGNEYGEEWHSAGKTVKKQNVFDDFIAAAEWLIREKRTTSDQLAIMGGSNGGLLVGAVEVQRPELFGACIPKVGVMDMLRFQKFTGGPFSCDEYGHIEKEDEFKSLLAYSPYHNIKTETRFPPTLIMTADTDDRVVPMHSFKFAAAMQRAQAADAPVLLRVETRAGHGSSNSVKKEIENAADRWAFLVKELRMDTANGR